MDFLSAALKVYLDFLFIYFFVSLSWIVITRVAFTLFLYLPDCFSSSLFITQDLNKRGKWLPLTVLGFSSRTENLLLPLAPII
jgi:hypothetical protein